MTSFYAMRQHVDHVHHVISFVTTRIFHFVCPSTVRVPCPFWGLPQSKVLSQVSGCRSFLGVTPDPGSFPGLRCQVLSRGYPSPGLRNTIVPHDRVTSPGQNWGYNSDRLSCGRGVSIFPLEDFLVLSQVK